MMALEQVLATVGRLDRRDLTVWIERRWVRPRHEAGGYLFTDLDVARVTLICDMRHDMAIDDEAMPVILGPWIRSTECGAAAPSCRRRRGAAGGGAACHCGGAWPQDQAGR